jgi:intracellular septation protein A
MLSHAPVNHPLRPVYRGIAALAGLATLAVGAIGFASTASNEYFAAGDGKVLGLGMNPGHALLMAASGVVILLSLLIGRNVDQVVNLLLGIGLMAVGTVGLASMRTDANFLNYKMANVVVAYLIGSLLLTAGLYIKSGRAGAEAAH